MIIYVNARKSDFFIDKLHYLSYMVKKQALVLTLPRQGGYKVGVPYQQTKTFDVHAICQAQQGPINNSLPSNQFAKRYHYQEPVWHQRRLQSLTLKKRVLQYCI